MSPDELACIEEFRRKALEGTITLEEMREAISLLRGSRRAAALAGRKKKAPTPTDTKPQPDSPPDAT